MQIDVPTTLGEGRLTIDAAPRPTAALWLGHGAGGGIDALDLAELASNLPARGITVIRHEQPWRVAGRRMAPRPQALDTAWLETAPTVRELAAGLPLFVGGRSAGARVACRTATSVDAAGVVCLAFPLHPPGRPEKTRIDELLMPTVPVLVLQGDRDTFGSGAAVADESRGRDGIHIVAVPGADHSMKVLKSAPFGADDVAALVSDEVARFILG